MKKVVVIAAIFGRAGFVCPDASTGKEAVPASTSRRDRVRAECIGLGETHKIHPVARPTLAEVRAGEELIDKQLIGICGAVLEEGL